MISKEKLNTILQYLLVFFVILDSRSVFSYFVDGNLGKIFTIFIVVILLLIFLLNANYKFKKSAITFIFFYLIYIILFFVKNVTNYQINFINNFFILFLLMFLVFCVYDRKNIENLFKAYVNTMFLIAIISLIFFFFGSLTNILSTNVIEIIDWGGKQVIGGYSYLHFNTQTTIMFNKVILRNTSIFVEGPMFALHLMFAMSLSLFFKRKILNKYAVIFGITILSTLSITGFLFYLFSLFYKYTFFNKSRIKVIILPIIFLFFLGIGTTFLNDKQSTNSYSIRSDDYSAGFKAFKDYPIFGSGFLNNNEAIKHMSSYRLYNTGLSNSFIIVLVHGGIYLTLFYLIPIFLNLKKLIFSKNKNLFLIEIILLQLYLLFTSAYQYTSLMMLFLAFDYYLLIFYKNNEEIRKIFEDGD